MASHSGGGSVSNGRTSNPKFLGLKKGNQEMVSAGHILVRQRGNKYYAGVNAGTGRDFTIFALKSGKLLFRTGYKGRTYLDIV